MQGVSDVQTKCVGGIRTFMCWVVVVAHPHASCFWFSERTASEHKCDAHHWVVAIATLPHRYSAGFGFCAAYLLSAQTVHATVCTTHAVVYNRTLAERALVIRTIFLALASIVYRSAFPNPCSTVDTTTRGLSAEEEGVTCLVGAAACMACVLPKRHKKNLP